ncbi:MAG: acyl-CoA dehydrogenase family protein [Dehalococcoidia bacterium]|nr:acyl-CoA dehydrogenase family protein [Dehalococcoidia bacterium]MCB9485833.1 acyl-CoA dehydrogenase family protein [Thermoflexaceae bacterium]
MDWRDTPEQAEFRAEVRGVVRDRLPRRYKDMAQKGGPGERIWEFDRKSPDAESRQAAVDWHAALNERRWVAPHWPVEYGGAGLSPMEQFILNQELARAGAPPVGGSGVGMLGPTLIVHGSDDQRKKYLPPILAGEVTWAQGYSEPGSGSDLASLQTRASRDGDDFVINGQKIWTSGAHTADSIFALVRTDAEAPKHRGISFILIEDIKSPGITVRPLVDMGNRHYFNEVFFEDVRVPAANLVGEENRGWYVGMTLLDFERSNIGGAVAARRSLSRLLDTIRADPGLRASVNASSVRHEIAQRYIETEVMYQFSMRIISMQNRGQVPNDEASMSKLYNSELSQRLAQTAMQATGLRGNLMEGDDASFAHAYIGMVPATIRGGTSEVQRNVIATRGLGLPRG